ncbi:hypothetical protein M0804_015066 [Polistes exclamans]|nr:hypothetical protein M0804_015068 [Polistes exclamans]KAI4473988.1 hypothetical protein M0804_015066 [Polistes exclamans]
MAGCSQVVVVVVVVMMVVMVIVVMVEGRKREIVVDCLERNWSTGTGVVLPPKLDQPTNQPTSQSASQPGKQASKQANRQRPVEDVGSPGQLEREIRRPTPRAPCS